MTPLPQQYKAELTGRSVARGRNGYFRAQRATLTQVTDDSQFQWVLDVQSQRRGKYPPVRLHLTTQDARELRILLRNVNGGLTKREYAIADALRHIEACESGLDCSSPHADLQLALCLAQVKEILKGAE